MKIERTEYKVTKAQMYKGKRKNSAPLCLPACQSLAGRCASVPDKKGFTFIEIMVVVVIIGLLIAIVSPNLMNRVEEARRIQTKTQIRNLEQALKLFKLDNGFYPSQEQGLKALMEKPTIDRIPAIYPEGGYLEKGRIPLDAWSRPFIYLSPGLYSEFDIISLGRDGKEGGESFDEDIYSWDME